MSTSNEKLSYKQERFCRCYAGIDSPEMFGDGLQSYAAAYQPDQTKKGWKNVAYASSSRMLKNVKICRRINELLSENGLNDQHVDKQLLFLLNQQADLSTKLGAIREYNKLKQRIEDKLKVDIQVNEVLDEIEGE